MNKHEIHGGARYVGGKVEKTVGDVVDSRDWQVAGVVDQVAGGAENLYGRAQSVASDVADAAPGVIEHARERSSEALHQAADEVRVRAESAAQAVRGNEGIAIAAATAAGLIGYALAWLIHGRRD
jgi:uncharacterized protein YjbJ (UPF0337 family)